MRLLVFLHGTTLMHPSAVGRTPAERVARVRAGPDPALRDFSAYVPIGDAVAKLWRWQEQGAEIDYSSSHRSRTAPAKDAKVLERHGFPPGRILSREPGETYCDVAARVLPDVLVEDDCESIGGTAELTYPQLRPDLRARITSIVVPEFEGIDHLPDSLDDLVGFSSSKTQPTWSKSGR